MRKNLGMLSYFYYLGSSPVLFESTLWLVAKVYCRLWESNKVQRSVIILKRAEKLESSTHLKPQKETIEDKNTN